MQFGLLTELHNIVSQNVTNTAMLLGSLYTYRVTLMKYFIVSGFIKLVSEAVY